jgi:ABC-type uncharacterized transport system permease subunit
MMIESTLMSLNPNLEESAYDMGASEATILRTITIPLLARALYYTSEIGAEIHSDLYRAVATVLSFVFQAAPGADVPEVEVPEELHFDANGRKMGAKA